MVGGPGEIAMTPDDIAKLLGAKSNQALALEVVVRTEPPMQGQAVVRVTLGRRWVDYPPHGAEAFAGALLSFAERAREKQAEIDKTNAPVGSP